MLFADARSSLVEILRSRVRNGELTERGLARMVGVSQPHIHNVLKGARLLSPELSDQILTHLRISILDLIERERIRAHLNFETQPGGYVYVPVLRGNLGPTCPWPTETGPSDRLPFPAAQLANIESPIAVRLAEDARMARTFSAGDIVLLDQSRRSRSYIDPVAVYVIKLGNTGVVRRIQLMGNILYLIPDDARESPAGWQRISVDGRQLSQYIRARAYFASSLYEWSAS